MSDFMKLACASAVSVVFLSACGGGGGSSSTDQQAAQAVTSFPFQSGYKALIATGEINKYTISGTCSGSATVSDSAPSASRFEGGDALAVTLTQTVTLTNCTPASSASTTVKYYDSNYNALGHSISGVEYGKFLTVPSAVPTSVKIGDTAEFGVETIYTDSTKTTILSRRTRSYVVEADTASTSTAIVNLITKTFNTANQLLVTAQTRHRISADGTLKAISVDQQFSTTSSTHLIYSIN